MFIRCGCIGSFAARRRVQVAAAAITAPVITQTSTAGANPFLWTTAENATFYPGYYWNVQTATGASTGAASTALLAGTTTANIIQQIEPGDLAGNTITFTGLITTSTDGPFALRERVGSEDGLGGYNWGSWSNVLTDTIAAPATTWSTTNKSTYGVLSGGNLTWSYDAAIGNASVGIASSSVKSSGKIEIGFTLDFKGATGFTDGINVGFALSSQTFASGFAIPGRSNSNGLDVLCSPHGDLDVYQGTAYLTTLPGAAATGVDNRALIDFTAKKVWFKVNGVVQGGDPVAGTGGIDISSWLTGSVVLWAGPEGNRAITIVPSPSGITSGFTAWG